MIWAESGMTRSVDPLDSQVGVTRDADPGRKQRRREVVTVSPTTSRMLDVWMTVPIALKSPNGVLSVKVDADRRVSGDSRVS